MNLYGVVRFIQSLCHEPKCLLPHQQHVDITTINFRQLKARGFKGIVFDKDNTLTLAHEIPLHPKLKTTVEECKKIFGHGKVIIFSNSAGSSDDLPQFDLAEKLEREMGLPVLRHGTKKPDGQKQLKDYFELQQECPLENIVMIGDRFGTDVVFGNTLGMFTIRTHPLSKKNETWINLQMQTIEQRIVQALVYKNLDPPHHPVWDNSAVDDKKVDP